MCRSRECGTRGCARLVSPNGAEPLLAFLRGRRLYGKAPLGGVRLYLEPLFSTEAAEGVLRM